MIPSPPTTLLLSILLSAIPSTVASPLPSLRKRDLTTGAKAGLGVGIAVAAILLCGLIIFFVIHIRRSRHLAQINKERAILAGEKNADGSDKFDKFAEVPPPEEKPAATGGGMRRQKSVKDRLMGPLYRGSTIDLMPMPKARTAGGNRDSTATMEGAHWDNVDGQPFLHKPWAQGESSPRPSFSSKRATRMMMMM
ncbi:hypothetical protein PV10_07187 [Exophiala mesophila]|uniref:Uncharacterized protein n=1 Tax=Exophiala mesophila TaxID=212818 RepID=A0A0D1XNY4_EXOME|nr:uncharacterized protein PV10_07187 [Exophiala mesophila]KIV89816.1 hypothetical protein PV10_07187 [Exophiala mesophila]